MNSKLVGLVIVLTLILATGQGCERPTFIWERAPAEGGYDIIPIGEPAEEVPIEIPTIPVEETPTEVPEMPAETPEAIETPATEEKGLEEGTYITKIVDEGEKVTLDLTATDPDGDPLTYTFSKPLNALGEWQTKKGDAGRYLITVTASDGRLTSSQKLLIIVNKLNNEPVLTVPAELTVKEGETVRIDATATDADDDAVTVTFSDWMASAEKKTGYDDAGVHTVTVTASDGTDTVRKTVTVTVENVDRKPKLDSIDDITVIEGETVTVTAKASDPDGDVPAITYSEPLDEKGEWKTAKGDAGTYKVTVTASDSELEDTETFDITVESANKAPVMQEIDDFTVDLGDTVTFTPTVSDPDGDDVTVTYGGWMTSSSYTTREGDGGEHTVTVVASDGELEAKQTVTVTVNRPPVFSFG
ncbi:hypothetical protein JXB02_05345 [Candidatus Woesearchaeota archaeon]|nr:hypothetical protein [Candidatus Woesearchaeota archaeon]